MRKFFFYCLTAFVLMLCTTQTPVLAQSKNTLGWVEKVRIDSSDLVLHAKLDTGAENCSLHAEKLKFFKKDGNRWVRFEIVNRHGQRKLLESRVFDKARIKGPSKKPRTRPVVRLGLCVGQTFLIADVNLRDRSNFDFPMLIGRSFLAGNAVVDPAVMYTSDPDCSAEKTK